MNEGGMVSDLYLRAKKVIKPGMGKQKLAFLLGVETPTARRLLQRYRGETEGHSTDPVYRRVRRLKETHPEWGGLRIAQQLGITHNKARLWLARYRGALQYTAAHPSFQSGDDVHTQEQGSGGEWTDIEQGNTRDLGFLGTRILTLQELLSCTKVDTKKWEVERFVVNKWEVGAKGPKGTIVTSPLFQVKAWLRRRIIETLVADVLSSMLTEFKRAAPEQPAIPRDPKAKGLLELSILDLHLGKFASAAETGTAYNLDLCRQMFRVALEDLISKTAYLKPAQVLFSIGNDFFNTDNLGKTTTAGTPQDEAVRWQESFVAGRVLIVEAIERLRKIAPVHVPVVSGNHDRQRAFYLGDALSCWFSKTPDITIDNSPALRKYYVFGSNLIGFSHGDCEPHGNLPIIMATEQQEAWAKTKFREWHIGHWHLKRKKLFVPVEDQQGVVVRIIPSLCPADAWHRSRGYQSKRAAEAFYFDPSGGCVAEFTHAA
jgi:hypothetical protein